jgi:two-component system, OmpR family, flagellar system response regulator FtcR
MLAMSCILPKRFKRFVGSPGMIVIVDERKSVVDAFVALFEREGVAAMGLCPPDYRDWITGISDADLAAVEAILLGVCPERASLCRLIAARSRAVIVAICEGRSLEETLELFAGGVDDVVRKPIHPREILARVNAVSRRAKPKADCRRFGEIVVFFDGRDPEIGGEVLQLPRRERRILEYLANSIGCRVSKAQIFNAVYGLFNENIDESVVESHISKLRKRLRGRLGYDPIDCKRFLGYRLAHPGEIDIEAPFAQRSSFAQERDGLIDHMHQTFQD